MNPHEEPLPTQQLSVSDDEIVLPEELATDRTYDIDLNGQHVWSLQPGKLPAETQSTRHVSWPKALHPFLRGHAEVALRDHVEDRTIASAHHVFADEHDHSVAVVDGKGRPLVLDKYMRLTKPLTGAPDEAVSDILDQLESLLAALEDAGAPAFICYGTLLGAVREGGFIGHDNDLDIAYLSDQTTPVDVIREGFRIERRLRDGGWSVRRGSGARLNVRLHMQDGSIRFVDVFTACWIDGTFYMQSDTGFDFPREALLPLQPVTLSGREVPAPADSERLLVATYGPSWRTPDPAFQYETPKWLARRLQGWFGGLTGHRKTWDAFYRPKSAWRQVPEEPSDFARWVSERYPSERLLLDIGSGTGRDALHFAHSRTVQGVDYSMAAMTRARRRTGTLGLPLTFSPLNLYDLRDVLALGTRLSRDETPPDLYARFVLHALNPLGQDHLFRLARMSLRRGGHLFLEFRTTQDRQTEHLFGPKFRRFLDVDEVAADIETYGGRVLERTHGTGLARLESEDPHVGRIVAAWDQEPAR